MSDWIKAANPFAAIDNQEVALAAARVSAFGMLLGAVNNIAEGWYTQNGGSEAAQRMVENMTGQVQTAEQIQAQSQFGLITVCALVVLHLVLAGVQWKKPNQVLPIVFLVLTIWGLGGAVIGLVMSEQMQAVGMSARPMWLTLVTMGTLAMATLLHIAGVRGASALGKFRQAQAY